MVEEGEVPNCQTTALGLSELAPVIRVEESVVVWHVQVLADQAKHLCLCPEGIVADNEGGEVLLNVHVCQPKSSKF